MTIDAAAWVDGSSVDPAVFERWPGYRVILVASDHVDSAMLAPVAEQLLADAHTVARAGEPGHVDAHTAQWHDAYRDFGVKPRVARPSSDALVRRAASERGLPSIDVLVDLYNAISILRSVPIGGEDLDRYDGPARLHLADGTEPFHTTADGESTVDHPEPGEPVWVDGGGVTCRRWNWRQTTRTAIDHHTTRVGFIIDSLDAPDHAGATAAAQQLADLLPGALVRTIDAATR
jgi:DNA/RNA-binding domain of Phe-tRNA-synthetase-like protein